jgi:hypothetical protein
MADPSPVLPSQGNGSEYYTVSAVWLYHRRQGSRGDHQNKLIKTFELKTKPLFCPFHPRVEESIYVCWLDAGCI